MPIGLSSKKFVAIDWDTRDVRAVLFRARADGIDLLKAVSVPIPSNVTVTDAESLGSFLRAALRQARIGAKQALLMIPRDRVVLNTLNLPPTPANEMAAMIQFQVSKELPFAADQATIDYAVSGDFDPKESCDVLVAAVRNEELATFKNVAHEAGLTVQSIGLRPHGNLVAVTSNWPEASSGTLMIVDVGPSLTEIDVVQNGTLTFSRAASVSLDGLWMDRGERVEDSRIMSAAVEDLAPDEACKHAVEAVLVEVTRSYEAYRATDPSLRIDRVVVAGASGIESQLAKALGGRFGVRAEVYAADRALNLSPKRARELRGFSAAIGLAMNHGQKGLSHFDFLHPKRPVSKRSLQMKKAPIAVAAAVMFLAAGVVAHFNWVRPKVKAADQLRGRLSQKKKAAEAFEDFIKKVEALEAWQQSEQHWPAELAKMTAAFPSNREAFATRVNFETRPPRGRVKRATSTARAQIRMASASLGNQLAERMREAGFEEVIPGRTVPQGKGRFGFGTHVNALIPKRPKRKKKVSAASATSRPAAEALEDGGVPDDGSPAAAGRSGDSEGADAGAPVEALGDEDAAAPPADSAPAATTQKADGP